MGRPAIAVGVVIQARMGSTRLPGKVLLPIAGRPLLGHIIDRVEDLRYPVSIVIATGDSMGDDAIAQFCAGRGVACFRGSELDVLRRYCECAREWGFRHVVRLTGDNPFPDVDELDRLVEFHLGAGNDYSSSLESLPVGVGAEIFAHVALDRCHREGHLPHHREHVNEYVLENRLRFRIGSLDVPERKRRPEIRLTVDTAEDLRRVRFVTEHASRLNPTTEEAIELCSRFA